MPRQLPQAGDAEERVIGACLQSPRAVETALLKLRPDQFYNRVNSRIYAAIEALYAEEEAVDIVTVLRRLDASHGFDDRPAWEGGHDAAFDAMRERLALIVASTTTSSNVDRHAQIVVEMWGKRRLIELFTPPMGGVWNGARPDTVIREVEKAVIAARSEIEEEGTTAVVDGATAALWLSDLVKHPPGPLDGIGTPWGFLPRFKPGRLYVLGGYPKDGKTAMSVQFLAAACNDGARVGYFSVEMSWQDLAARICSTFGVPYGELQKGLVAPFYRDAFETALQTIHTWPVEIVDDASPTAADIVRYQRLGRYEYIVIDYLQRMPYVDRFDLNKQIKAITTLARKAEIPILLLSQFSRPQNTHQGNPFPRPTMSMFAETSVIEKEAAMAMSVWRRRDEHGNPGSEAELNVMANRYGPPGMTQMVFKSEEQRFAETHH